MINLAQKRRQKAKIAKALDYLIDTHGCTYRQAARLYGVSVNQLRARINYRHGSLADARMHKALRQRTWARPCICCGDKEPRPYGQYRCDRCLAEAGKIHDGVL